MDPLRIKQTKRDGPEKKIQDQIIINLRAAEWFVKSTHGNEFQSGLPDLWASHKHYGYRWIEVKNPAGYSFTRAQLDSFPMFFATGVGIWILTGSGPEDMQKLFKPMNGEMFLLRWRNGVRM